ncbi:GNAT family N-acetyltransferase [Lacticaseibacillus pantheris]|jgi:GNAT superfamily N-acetyltransferase|uniref:GNAT family N-acetyltransferase n=1 Tax=Lacticaseibacillus pantheris TaxID=171523 RepID=UPI002658B5F2|nr:GNAT family N-acetyltransferase [Lacticaseibacillus pantheris]WKF85346.1 GNAT family N-acetyltransferase [Lacticaseibacillus pantheris]
MVEYMFERGLNIHEIKALYGGAGWQAEANNAATLAEGLANSTVMTARDNGRLVGMVRGVSDMHTVLLLDQLVVLPEYQEDGVDAHLLQEMIEYFRQVESIVAVGHDDHLNRLLQDNGFRAGDEKSPCLIRPKQLVETDF